MQPSTLLYKTANGRQAFRLSEIPDEGYRFEGAEVRPVVDGVPLAAPLPFTLKILREEEVLVTVARGRTNAEIADELYISLSTVKTHLASLMNTLGARNRVEIAMWAYETGRIGG